MNKNDMGVPKISQRLGVNDDIGIGSKSSGAEHFGVTIMYLQLL
jgi:hypothetical protein